MKLLYICNGSNFLGAGGMEYHLVDVAGQLKEHGVNVGFVVRQGTYLENHLLAGAPNLYHMSCTGYRKIISYFQLIKAIIRFKPDIISINRERDIVQTYLIAKLCEKLTGEKLILTAVFHNLGWKIPFNLNLLNGIIFPNNYIKDEYFDDNINIPTEIIYHGINISKFHNKSNFNTNRKRKYFTDVTVPIIGMVGEFRKNQIELVDVAIALRKKTDIFKFAIVGRGTEEELEALTSKISLNRLNDYFIITGNINRALMPDVYYDFDLSVTTNRHEPFGIVFIESLASYTPLVAYNSGGPVEVLAGGGGYLVNGGSEEMAQQIYQLINDIELLKKNGDDARKSAEQFFSVEAMGYRHYQFYMKLVSK